ncbi:MAG: DUF1631 family protein [Burkholderiales bacterium]|nr:DUF1631 family protein [Burkholderiales bacterium]
MSSSQASTALQLFVEDEILRAPLLAEQVIDATTDHVRQVLAAMGPRERSFNSDLLASLLAHRQAVVARFTASLRERAAKRSAADKPAPESRLALSLVDEDEVAVDVEIANAIEAIRSAAEYELRELQTFTSALVGDMDVARDHNPLGAEAYARAFWAAVNVLPLSRGYHLALLRHAAPQLAQVLRKAFAGASSRLESAGIEPAAYRTLVLPSGSRRQRVGADATYYPDLQRIRDSMPVHHASVSLAPGSPFEQVLRNAEAEIRRLPPETDFAAQGALRERHRNQLIESATSRVDQQLVELLSRLFDAILSDESVASDLRLMISRLQASTLRVALRDPLTLSKEGHPVWQFTDRVAFYGEILPGPGHPGRERVLRYVQGLVEHLVAEPEPSAGLYQWALERLQQFEHRRLEQRCAAAADEIAELQRLEDRLQGEPGSAGSLAGALDVSQLDTVPAQLIDDETPAGSAPSPDPERWLERQRPGAWWRLLMQGRWVHAQLLWPGERGEIWLLGDGASPATWAVRRRALLTLRQARLLGSLEPRSLVRDAAKRVMRQLVR